MNFRDIAIEEVTAYTWLDQSAQVNARIQLSAAEHEAIFRNQLQLRFLGVEIKLSAVQVQEGGALVSFLVATHLLQD